MTCNCVNVLLTIWQLYQWNINTIPRAPVALRKRTDLCGLSIGYTFIWTILEIIRSDVLFFYRNYGEDYSRYLSNVPKLNRKLKPVHPKDDTSIADALADKVRVLCWVITHPENHRKLPVAIKNTWGRKCTKLIFLSTEYGEFIQFAYFLYIFIFFRLRLLL